MTKLRKSQFLGASLLCLITLGCADKGGLGQLVGRPADPNKPLIENIAKDATARIDPKAIARCRLTEGRGVIPVPAFEAYANQLEQKILYAWPGVRPDITVRVMPGLGYDAAGDKDGHIYIYAGVLEQVADEEELVGMLAHETAHLLLNHGESSIFEELHTVAMNGVEIGFAISGRGAVGKEAATAAYQLIGTEAFRQASRVAVFPTWTRDQEAEADKLGADLMARAGFNPRGMTYFLERVAAADKDGKAKREAQLAEQTRAQAAANQHHELADALKRLDAELERTHPDPEARQKEIEQYQEKQGYFDKPHRDVQPLGPVMKDPSVLAAIESTHRLESALAALHYENDPHKAALILSPPPPPQPADGKAAKTAVKGEKPKARKKEEAQPPVVALAPIEDSYWDYVSYQVLRANGKTAEARERLVQATKFELSILEAHVALADELASNGRVDQSYLVIKAANNSFGHPDELLPKLITYAKRNKDDTSAALYQSGCMIHATGTLRDQCSAAGK